MQVFVKGRDWVKLALCFLASFYVWPCAGVWLLMCWSPFGRRCCSSRHGVFALSIFLENCKRNRAFAHFADSDVLDSLMYGNVVSLGGGRDGE